MQETVHLFSKIPHATDDGVDEVRHIMNWNLSRDTTYITVADVMISGRAYDPWSSLPVLVHIKLVGLFLRANAQARRAHAKMIETATYQSAEQ